MKREAVFHHDAGDCELTAPFPVYRQNKELLMNPVVISRNPKEKILIEGSINSVRISLKIKQIDDIEQILCKRFVRFMTQRAESFVILRRKPIQVISRSFFCFAVN